MTESDLPRLDDPGSDSLEDAAIRARLTARLFGEDVEPTTIGRFLVDGVLGGGGMGVVYRATDPRLGRAVAIKLLRRDAMPGDDQARLMREATTLAKLSHPNVVSIYEVGEHEDALFFLMELVDGVTLDAWQSGSKRSVREILDVYLQAMDGLAAAHRLGVVHRDFKPANVLVGRDGRVRVADFGLAHGRGPSTAASSPLVAAVIQTDSIHVGGTPAYMAPEQAAGGPVDARSDQFSLCVSLHESLFGVRPFEPDAIRKLGLGLESPLTPRRGRSDRPRWLRRIVARGLDVDPANRWPSIETLAMVIRRAPRRRVVATSAAAALLALGAVGYVGAAMRPELCPWPAAELSSVWNDDRRAQLQRTVEAPPLGFAARAMESAAGDIDDWTSRWLEARHASCRATRVDGRQSEARLDASVACLDRAKGQLDAIVRTLAAGDLVATAESEAMLGDLESPDACLLVGAESNDHALGGISAVAASLSDIAIVATDAGALDTADTAASQALALAMRAGTPELRAQALHARARADIARGQPHSARDALSEAVKLAESSRSDHLAARYWCELVALAAVDLEDVTIGREWRDRSEVAVTRLGQPAEAVACHEQASGLLAGAGGKWSEAVDAHRRAVAAWGRVTSPPSGRVARARRQLGNALEESGDAEGARAVYEALLTDRRARLGERHPEIATLEIDLARALSRLGQLDRARSLGRAALETLSEVFGPESLQHARALAVIADIELSLGEIDAALESAARAHAVEQRKGVGERERTGALAVLANASYAAGRLDDALALFRELAAELSPRSTQWRAEVENNIGVVLCMTDRCSEARDHFEWVIDHLQPDEPTVLYARSGLARVALAAGAFEEAAANLRVLLPKAERFVADGGDAELLAEVQWSLARALVATGADRAEVSALLRSARPVYERLGNAAALIDLRGLEARRGQRPTRMKAPQ